MSILKKNKNNVAETNTEESVAVQTLVKSQQKPKPTEYYYPDKKELKKEKANRVLLQNLIFGTNEKKLMVSDEFLDNMAKQYISNRMKKINIAYDTIRNARLPIQFFKAFDEMQVLLDELIKIEPYYKFKNPIPSVYKNYINENLPEFRSAMLSRSWNNILTRFPLSDNISQEAMVHYDNIINNMLSFRDRLSDEDLSLIDSLYVTIHGESSDEIITNENSEESEVSSSEENTET